MASMWAVSDLTLMQVVVATLIRGVRASDTGNILWCHSQTTKQLQSNHKRLHATCEQHTFVSNEKSVEFVLHK